MSNIATFQGQDLEIAELEQVAGGGLFGGGNKKYDYRNYGQQGAVSGSNNVFNIGANAGRIEDSSHNSNITYVLPGVTSLPTPPSA